MADETRLIQSFPAVTSDGEQIIIEVWQDYAISRTRAGTERIPTLKELRTTDGRHANWISQGNYMILGHWGEEIPASSTDPQAP